MPRLHSTPGSLERRLPVLMGGLVAVAVLATLLVVQAELRGSALDSAGERLARVAGQFAQLAGRTSAQRAEAMTAVAAAPAVARLAAGVSTDTAAALDVLERLRTGADSALPVRLRAPDGRVLARVDDAAAPLAAEPAGASAARAGSTAVPEVAAPITYGTFELAGEHATFVATVPVLSGGRVVGYLEQERRIGAPAVSEQLERLLGAGLRIVFVHSAGGPWVSLEGAAVGRGTVPQLNSPFEREDAGRWISYATPVPGHQWLIIAEVPRRAALHRAAAATRRLVVLGGLLMVLGVGAAWLVSRRVTAPLRRLAAAADAIAAGDFSRRTGVTREDEIGQLARSFDAMAEYVDLTHAEMAHRFNEARRLTGQLELANTRLRDVVAELDVARREAQLASAAKSEFLATMSHEIRTPINAMIGFTELLELGVPGPLTENQRQYVARIRSSGEHLVGLVNDVLDFAKIESGSLRVERADHAAAPVVEAAVAMMQGRAVARGIELTASCAHGEAFVGDAQRVQQILLNLVGNALKFSPEGGTVHVSCEARAGLDGHPDGGVTAWTCITVGDAGPGVPAEQHDAIFEPFRQGTSGYTRPHGGTGLGLAISRRLARMMGGDVTVESEAGAGARFTVWLPRASSAVPAGR